MNKKINVEKAIGGVGWILVIVAGVVISSWSLYDLAREGRLPVGIAALTGVTFDGLAFVSSVQAMAWNRIPGAYGVGSRLAMMCAAGMSAYLNYKHGEIMKVNAAIALMLASAPLAGLWALENHIRFLHRGSNRKQPLAKPELLLWALFPRWAFHMLRVSAEVRMMEMEGITLPGASNESMREWLQAHGFDPGHKGPISMEHRKIYAKAMNGGKS